MFWADGGEDWTSDRVEQSISEAFPTEIALPGVVLADIRCVHRDGAEFACLLDMTNADGREQQALLSVVCEDDCLWRVED